MAGQGASLQNYNNELVKCIEDLREKREEINRQVGKYFYGSLLPNVFVIFVQKK